MSKATRTEGKETVQKKELDAELLDLLKLLQRSHTKARNLPAYRPDGSDFQTVGEVAAALNVHRQIAAMYVLGYYNGKELREQARAILTKDVHTDLIGRSNLSARKRKKLGALGECVHRIRKMKRREKLKAKG